MNEELRCYTFTLFQLRTMQQGIQAAHAIVELGVSMIEGRADPRFPLYWEWATQHKTMIFLNGGDHSEMKELWMFMNRPENVLPWADFHESFESLDGLLTSIAIVVPERIYKTADELRKNKALTTDYPDGFTDWELELIDIISRAGFAT